MEPCVLVIYDEIALKSDSARKMYERIFVWSIKDCLKKNGFDKFDIRSIGRRFIVKLDDTTRASDVLKNVPGIRFVAPALQFSYDSKENLLEKAKDQIIPLIKDKTFKLFVKRKGSHTFSSRDITFELGDMLVDHSAGVDVHNPQAEVYIEIRDDKFFLHSKKIEGIGGLPPTSSGRVLCLFSGGIDSPVAAIEMLKRGYRVDFLFCDLVGQGIPDTIVDLYSHILTDYVFNYKPIFFHVDLKDIIGSLKEDVDDYHRQIAFKRVLYKVASSIGTHGNFDGIFTGEALSQKSTQTIQSLGFLEKDSDMIMIRPLITMNKEEIIAKARRYGTFEYSQRVKEYCNLSKGAVTTHPKEEIRETLPSYEKEIEKATKEVKIHKGMIIKQDPEQDDGALLVDMRPETIRKKRPIDSDFNLTFLDPEKDMSSLDKSKPYLLICQFGARSQGIVDELNNRGFKSWAMNYDQFISLKLRKDIQA